MDKLTKKQIKVKEKKERTKKWKEIREKVLERDKACILCGIYQEDLKKGQGLNVHHILAKEFTAFRHLEFDERNLITVCPTCHKFGVYSFHKCPLYALESFKKKFPTNYKFLAKEVLRLQKVNRLQNEKE